jgi:hypothetical protein
MSFIAGGGAAVALLAAFPPPHHTEGLTPSPGELPPVPTTLLREVSDA